MGITGTWEGYVPSATDLYLRGNNTANFTGSNFTFESGGIHHGTGTSVANLVTGKLYNLSSYNYLNFQIYLYNSSSLSGSLYSAIELKVGKSSSDFFSTSLKKDITTGQIFDMSVNLAVASFTIPIYIDFSHSRVMPDGSMTKRGCDFWVYHIWLS